MDSWMGGFKGDAAAGLWDHAVRHYARADKKTYARYTAIVQSSGMGKSRVVDEMGKTHFVIPICLRESNTSGWHLLFLSAGVALNIISPGFPPPDVEVRDFLAASKEGYYIKGDLDVYNRAAGFISALFAEVTNQVKEIQKGGKGNNLQEMAAEFRRLMTEGQTIKRCNDFRVRFYQRVVENAGQVC
jgi:hypothetical protein